MRLYDVIYLWRGERHRTLQNMPASKADDLVAELRSKGWRAWKEQVS